MCTQGELNRALVNLTEEVRAARAETAHNTAAVANFAGKMDVWQTSTLKTIEDRLVCLEQNQRADGQAASANGARLAFVVGLAVVLGNLAVTLAGSLWHG